MSDPQTFKIQTKNFLPHQLAWWKLTSFIKLLVGGYGCGKSYIAALRAIYLSFLNSGYHGMLVSPTFGMAKKTIIPHLLSIMDRSEMDYVYNKTDHFIQIENWDGGIFIGSGEH